MATRLRLGAFCYLRLAQERVLQRGRLCATGAGAGLRFGHGPRFLSISRQCSAGHSGQRISEYLHHESCIISPVRCPGRLGPCSGHLRTSCGGRRSAPPVAGPSSRAQGECMEAWLFSRWCSATCPDRAPPAPAAGPYTCLPIQPPPHEERMLKAVRPENVVLELCRSRTASLEEVFAVKGDHPGESQKSGSQHLRSSSSNVISQQECRKAANPMSLR